MRSIEVQKDVYVPARFQLMIASNRALYDCRVVWLQENRIGVEFGQPKLADS
jgi:hypothetical protein